MVGAGEVSRAVTYPVDDRRIALVDLLDRLLAGGVVVTGEITLTIADVDLVRISLRALIASVGTLADPDGEHGPYTEDRTYTEDRPYTGGGP
ncbi:gas vesicle protein [Kitasatospora sp. DSM 101779]|uniref:gas vesicle protein n=1 Tax=Kitasatospora sp. DSM 101779 TaxID=2853165 RepID=UPI0029549DED|nr:gas vesicle protein [Kitasatospora sp. DSM 101779]